MNLGHSVVLNRSRGDNRIESAFGRTKIADFPDREVAEDKPGCWVSMTFIYVAIICQGENAFPSQGVLLIQLVFLELRGSCGDFSHGLSGRNVQHHLSTDIGSADP